MKGFLVAIVQLKRDIGAILNLEPTKCIHYFVETEKSGQVVVARQS